jgi:hypothetical protein
MSWFPRILKFEHLLKYKSMEQWLTSIQTYAVLFKKNCKLVETSYSVIIAWKICWWHQDMQINCSHVCYYCHCMFHLHPPSCLAVCLLNKWTKRPSLITIFNTIYCLACGTFWLVCRPAVSDIFVSDSLFVHLLGPFLTLATHGAEWSISQHSHFKPGEERW